MPPTKQMEVCGLLSARRHQGWRVFTALRPVIAVLLIALMAGNAMAGSFSGFVHVHHDEHIGHHHHHDGDDHHHHHDDNLDGDASTPAAKENGPTVSGSDGPPEKGQIHVHDPIVTLGLAKVVQWVLKPIQPAWEPRPPNQLVSDHRISSERPPRAV
jgi:hypothetical protein